MGTKCSIELTSLRPGAIETSFSMLSVTILFISSAGSFSSMSEGLSMKI